MPKLSYTNNSLMLSMADRPELVNELDVNLYFTSILGLTYDGNSSYYQQHSGDLVSSAHLIQNILNYLNSLGISFTTDEQTQRILNALENSELELNEGRERGTKIMEKSVTKLNIDGFARVLKPYQIRSVMLASEVPYVANFSVPGSGKTTIAYAAYALMKSKALVDKIVVIGPRSSFMPWEEEFESCFNKKPNSLRVVGIDPDQLEEKASGNEVILLTYQMASVIPVQLVKLLSKYNCLLVLDESHHIKSFAGGLWAHSVLRIAPYAKRRLILTGTPMPNSLLDLWSQFTFLWPFKNLLGEQLAYRSLQSQDRGLTQIKQTIRPFFSRITKSELKLPSVKFEKIKVPIGTAQRAIYNSIAVATLTEMTSSPNDKMKLREWRKNKVIRLLQAASNPSLLTEYSEEFRIPPLNIEGLSVVELIEKYSKYEVPSKLVEAVKLTRRITDDGEKVIIWNTFVHNIMTLQNMLTKQDPLILYGEVPKDENEDENYNREKIIRRFKTDPNARVLIANPNSCAESVSLHKICKHAIYVDRTFNAGQYIQSLDRIHRIGLGPDDHVIYHILIGQNTVDERIDDRLEQKYRRMLDLLDDDLPVVDFDTSINELSDIEFEKDFQAVYDHLKTLKSGEPSD